MGKTRPQRSLSKSPSRTLCKNLEATFLTKPPSGILGRRDGSTGTAASTASPAALFSQPEDSSVSTPSEAVSDPELDESFAGELPTTSVDAEADPRSCLAGDACSRGQYPDRVESGSNAPDLMASRTLSRARRGAASSSLLYSSIDLSPGLTCPPSLRRIAGGRPYFDAHDKRVALRLWEPIPRILSKGRYSGHALLRSSRRQVEKSEVRILLPAQKLASMSGAG